MNLANIILHLAKPLSKDMTLYYTNLLTGG